ncbi:hypothetical protein HAX54_027911, partial [Datura stramonium]|nr:hypothetical protein [Datura stramonium]
KPVAYVSGRHILLTPSINEALGLPTLKKRTKPEMWMEIGSGWWRTWWWRSGGFNWWGIRTRHLEHPFYCGGQEVDQFCVLEDTPIL